MEYDTPAEKLFHTEIMSGIYQISSTLLGPTGDKKSLAPGNPTQNSYLVIGATKALLFDLALDEPGLKEYAEQLAGKPVQLVLSHGHIDHIFHLNRFSEVWMHPADEILIREGMPGQMPVDPCPTIHALYEGNIIDLGDRLLDVFNVPGHTNGSILLLDRQTRTLLAGDTCTRRLLYGLTDYVPLERFCESLRRIQKQDFDIFYSAHDRCSLPKAYLEYMIAQITDELPHTQERWDCPGFGQMIHLTSGDVYSLRYFDMAIPVEYMQAPV